MKWCNIFCFLQNTPGETRKEWQWVDAYMRQWPLPKLCISTFANIVMTHKRLANSSVVFTVCPRTVLSTLATSINPHKTQSTHLLRDRERIAPQAAKYLLWTIILHKYNYRTHTSGFSRINLASPQKEWKSNFWRKIEQEAALKWHSHLLLPCHQLHFKLWQVTFALSSNTGIPFIPIKYLC